MARINVEQKALTDLRFELLGGLLQTSRHDALGRMVVVWNECQERGSHTLPERLLGAIMGNRDGAEWVVEAGLAEWVDDNTVRIKGTVGRIEWLSRLRGVAAAGGVARAKSAPRTGGRFVPAIDQPSTSHMAGEPPAISRPSSSAPAPAPAPALTSSSEAEAADSVRMNGRPRALSPVCPIDPGEVFAAWNRVALDTKLPVAKHLTDKRRKAILGRAKDPFWLENWQAALARIAGSEFCHGVGARPGWKADLDFFLQQDTVTKAVEGKYDDGPAAPAEDPDLAYMRANAAARGRQEGAR